MRLAITGFSSSGKTTLFNAITGLNLPVAIYPTLAESGAEPHIGVVNVPDERVDRLASILKPKKKTYATIEYIDYAGLTKDAIQNSNVFNILKDADAIVHVIRAFEDPAVLHPSGAVDPVRDVKEFESELILHDLELIEKRLERIALALKKGKKEEAHGERDFLAKCRKALENETPLRDIDFNKEEKKIMQTYQFLTTKPEIIILNIGEEDLNTDKERELINKINSSLVPRPSSLSLGGKLEMEVSQLPEDERGAFLDSLGIKEPAKNKLCRASYEALGLITFFTVVGDEVRAWTIKKGTPAQKAGGKVHSDMERGFIKAEVISFDDFLLSGESMAIAKSKGLLRLEGKDYIVKDGDIINFRFHV